jgi:hypothetical protein
MLRLCGGRLSEAPIDSWIVFNNHEGPYVVLRSDVRTEYRSSANESLVHSSDLYTVLYCALPVPGN